MLRIAKHYPEFYAAITVHMCDASPGARGSSARPPRPLLIAEATRLLQQ